MSTIEKIDLNGFLSQCQKVDNQTVRPILIDLAQTEPENNAKNLVGDKLSTLTYRDLVPVQLKEYVKLKNPKTSFSESELKSKAATLLEERGGDRYGTLVYYPWNKNLLRILPEEEFIAVRTARNKHKITEAEQQQLSAKTLGVIGLSVGQSAAVTMAIERVFGSIRIADFDHLELSNLNRIRSGLHNLELTKTMMVAREIAEIDPYLKVELFDQGITEENITDFIGEGKEQLDLLIEECDELPVKLLARLKAREKQIPVVMDTSDRGMLDVEMIKALLIHVSYQNDLNDNCQNFPFFDLNLQNVKSASVHLLNNLSVLN